MELKKHITDEKTGIGYTRRNAAAAEAEGTDE